MQVIDENSSRINELEAEMRTRERLADVYKEASEVADKEIEELKESETRLEILLKEKEEREPYSKDIGRSIYKLFSYWKHGN
jgi:vacuolar-type H+-ATPase subunit H